MYESEENIIQRAKAILQNPSKSDLLEELGHLTEAYGNLLADLKFITKISDRYQDKLNTKNQDLKRKQEELEAAQKIIVHKNKELEVAKQSLEEKVYQRTKDLKQAYDSLLISTRELDNFVYRASHDLKGPIARIMGLCQVALLDIKDDNAREYFNLLVKTSSHLDDILVRLLGINQLKKTVSASQWFEWRRVIEKNQDTISELLALEQLNFTMEGVVPDKIYTDPSIFKIIMINMLDFSVKNVDDDGGDEPFIKLILRKEGESLYIEILSNGRAIPKHVFNDIFTLFQRTNTNPAQTGMELYTAKLAVEKLQGKINLKVSSEVETIFDIVLPNVFPTQ